MKSLLILARDANVIVTAVGESTKVVVIPTVVLRFAIPARISPGLKGKPILSVIASSVQSLVL